MSIYMQCTKTTVTTLSSPTQCFQLSLKSVKNDTVTAKCHWKRVPEMS